MGVHSLGYVASDEEAGGRRFLPGLRQRHRERRPRSAAGRPMTRAGFDAQLGPEGALLIGEPDEVVEKILRHSEALGGISRITFQMNAASLPHDRLMRAIETIGTRVAPAVKQTPGGRPMTLVAIVRTNAIPMTSSETAASGLSIIR